MPQFPNFPHTYHFEAMDDEDLPEMPTLLPQPKRDLDHEMCLPNAFGQLNDDDLDLENLELPSL